MLHIQRYLNSDHANPFDVRVHHFPFEENEHFIFRPFNMCHIKYHCMQILHSEDTMR